MLKVFIAAGVLGLVFIAAPGWSQVAAATAVSAVEIVECKVHDELQEDKDRDLAGVTLKEIGNHDLARLDALMPDLQAALARAPDAPSNPEHCNDKIIVYTDDMQDLLRISSAVSRDAKMASASVVSHEPLPYGLLAYSVGWIDFEHKDFAQAEKAYRRGLLNDPDRMSLISELSATLCNLARPQEALAVVDDFLAGHPILDDSAHGILLRKRGYALVELGRLNEGEAAYKESLIYAPNNPTAEAELQYIQEQRAKSPKA